jgi:HlyD family secretion protein
MKFGKILKKFWWVILIVVLIGGFLALRSSAKNKTASASVKTIEVQKQDLVDSLSESGEIDATEKAELRFQTSGLLTWVGVKEGDFVKKNQVLASLDKRQLQNQMSQLLNSYMTNRWNFEQNQANNVNWQTNAMTDTARDTIKRTLDENQFSLNNAVLDVQAQDLALKFANLWTPIEGLVTNIDAPTAGQNITPATATFEVINPKSIYFSVAVDQTDVTKFKVGQKGTVTLDSYSDKPIEGTVTSIGFTPMTNQTGTMYEVKLSLNTDNTDYGYRMGMTGDVDFIFKEIKNVLTVPASYIKTDSNGVSTVIKMVGKAKQKVEVKTGESIDGNTEIISGLNEKDVIYSN